MTDAIRTLLEQMGLGPVVIALIVVALFVVGSIYTTNLGGVKDRLEQVLRRPAPPGQARPLLTQTVEIVTTPSTFNNGEQMQVDHVVLLIRNEGSEIAEQHHPQLIVEREGKVILDTRSKPTASRKYGSVPPNGNVGFDMLQLLAHELSGELQGYGMEYALLDREFKVTTFSTYSAPDCIRKFDTPTFTFFFQWSQPSDFSDEIKARWYNASATRPSQA